MKDLTREELEQKYTHLENEKLENLLQQVRRQNRNIYVQVIPQVERIFRWSNPFRPIINEYDDYTVHRMNADGSVTRVYHDYRSLKSFLIGFLEGYNLCKAKSFRTNGKKRKSEIPLPYRAPKVKTEEKMASED